MTPISVFNIFIYVWLVERSLSGEHFTAIAMIASRCFSSKISLFIIFIKIFADWREHIEQNTRFNTDCAVHNVRSHKTQSIALHCLLSAIMDVGMEKFIRAGPAHCFSIDVYTMLFGRIRFSCQAKPDYLS